MAGHSLSSGYVTEPPTKGKVIIKTTFGDLDVELFAKETPMACRNFVQLCLEGYYDNCKFHRVIKDFMAQTGDPTGTGNGGESIYDGCFKDEFHSRLRFTRRGLLGMANDGKNRNSSQFFITLGNCDWLNKKHTLFGKITGDTIYNILRFNEIGTNEETDEPLGTILVRSIEVLNNPFPDIVPRKKVVKTVEDKPKKKKRKRKKIKNNKLLSFGDEADEEEREIASRKKTKVKALYEYERQDEFVDSTADDTNSSSLVEPPKKKQKLNHDDSTDGEQRQTSSNKLSRLKYLKNIVKELKKEVFKPKVDEHNNDDMNEPEDLSEIDKMREKYATARLPKKERVKKVRATFDNFDTMLQSERKTFKKEVEQNEKEEDDSDSESDDFDPNWFKQQVAFPTEVGAFKTWSLDDYEIFDSKNPNSQSFGSFKKKILRKNQKQAAILKDVERSDRGERYSRHDNRRSQKHRDRRSHRSRSRDRSRRRRRD